MSRSAAASSPSYDPPRSIDDLDRDIGRLARQINADSYRWLLLVREFDDRFGFAKWSFKSCAEWLTWRCSISLSAAREKVRAAQTLRGLPAIAAAFADGRLSYSKVRALTRVAQAHDEDLLLAYALDATVSQVEQRCRQIRNVAPAAQHGARRIWARRSLALWRSEASGTLRLTVELPIEEGELIARAIDCAVAAGEVTTGVEPETTAESKGAAWRAQQADALVAVAKAYLDSGGAGGEHGATADRYQVVVHVDEQALRDGAGRSDLPLDTVKRLSCDGSVISVIDDERGHPLDVGRQQRTVSTALKRALYARDRGCTFPGCHRARYLDAHHLDHWAEGGETSLPTPSMKIPHVRDFAPQRCTRPTQRFVSPRPCIESARRRWPPHRSGQPRASDERDRVARTATAPALQKATTVRGSAAVGAPHSAAALRHPSKGAVFTALAPLARPLQ